MFNRRLLAISILLAGCSLAVSSSAQEDSSRGKQSRAEPHEARALGRQSQIRMLRHLDSNGDKLISLEEFTARGTANYERQFSRADRDNNGYVSADEDHPRRRGATVDIDPAALRECIEENGGLAELREDRFAAADKDGDGALSQEEFFMQLEQRAFDQFARMDTDADGQLIGAELATNMLDRQGQRRLVRECFTEQIDPFL